MKRRTNSHKPRNRKDRSDDGSSYGRKRTVEERKENKYGMPVLLDEEMEEQE